MVASPEASGGRISLDKPPPLPPKTATRERSILDAGQQQSGISGADAVGNPQIEALQAAQGIESGFQKLVQVFPGMQEMAAAAISALRMSVADELAGITDGGGGPTGQMGGAPMMLPPPSVGMMPPQGLRAA